MAKKHVCVSFDFECDKNYYYLLEAWNKNPSIDFHITDCTPREIQTKSVDVVKQVLSEKIGEARYMIAIIGNHSNDLHPDYKKIGYRNWQAYEIEKNYEKGNKLLLVFLDSSNVAPVEYSGIGAKSVYKFGLENINKALQELSR